MNPGKKSAVEIVDLIEKKLVFFQDVIQKTILHVQNNKFLDILGISQVNNCIQSLLEISKKIQSIDSPSIKKNTNNVINILQTINNELSTLFKMYGTQSFEDLCAICFVNNSIHTHISPEKVELLNKFFHPTSYKVCNKTKHEDNSKKIEIIDIYKVKSFHLKVYGIQILFHDVQKDIVIIVTGIVDDVLIESLNNKFILDKKKTIEDNIPSSPEFKEETFQRFIQSLNLKDYLIYESSLIYSKYIVHLRDIKVFTQKSIAQLIKDFMAADLCAKRSTIIQLLIHSNKYDNQYLAYLLYDLLSNDTSGTGNTNIDTQEQTILFDSFPWSIKFFFKEAMQKTIQYTNELSNFDIQKIPLEQQICLLKTPESVKEKAIQKLKELKSKSEDSGSKARQYLDGLLKIPFSVYKKEPILNIMNDIRIEFNQLFNIQLNANKIYTSLEILHSLKNMKTDHVIYTITNTNYLTNLSKKERNLLVAHINSVLNLQPSEYHTKKIPITINKKQTIQRIQDIITDQSCSHLLTELLTITTIVSPQLEKNIHKIKEKYSEINTYMNDVKATLDKAIHGHDKAKKQMERIIGQWINGKQDGYCFGFEGPPGVGKTTLAKKGLANCLKDENQIPRPFSMIQMGGDANGSSLHGHNYTYVGSTWGSIVQILIDKKCMNPIIFIDEIDKISKTEHGKEIIGILTHLLDPAQNDCFQDKYFSGIDLDLSKALFILSYNDAEAIDKILLDRVHRIQFKNLSLEEKVVISNTHILPEIYEKMGLTNMILFTNEELKFIIDEYTCESGVRKLKEILFEIVGEINLNILKNTDTTYTIPIRITVEDIKHKYFKDKQETLVRKVHTSHQVGYVNGMYATSIGTGGILPIHAKFFPSNKFLDLKLTGLQQDVMRESMHVSLTVAWNLTPDKKQLEIRKKYDVEKNRCGINIHTGDNAVAKDGPSGGCAITCVLYSLLNDIPIKPEFAITGEIQMSGEVTAIGGLTYKILGSLKSGVKSFLFPKENEKDFKEFHEKYKDNHILQGISFYPIAHVEEAFALLF